MPQLATAFFPSSAFFSRHLASRAEVVDAEPEACCKDDPVAS